VSSLIVKLFSPGDFQRSTCWARTADSILSVNAARLQTKFHYHYNLKTMKPQKLLLATYNEGKLREFSELFSRMPVEICSLREFPGVLEIAETGATFQENAALKAVGYARQTGLPSLADDSGLEVEALGGAPGVFSARYAGNAASDEQKQEKLLLELKKTGDLERKARFVCTIAFADAKGEIIRSETGICNGTIAAKPSGKEGFGYDPIFIPAGYDKTFGELSAEIKGQISHRAHASQQIQRFLRDFFVFFLDHADFTD
jgi:XTP/dITP diphosphohydrolase